jgi:hypothetical protein
LGQNAFAGFSDSDKEEKNILSKFSKSSISSAFLLDQALLHCYNKAIVSWEKIGYQASGNFCYSSDDNRLKMFPMHFHVDGTGKLDEVLLCFGKNTNGEWKSLKSLSGFDLEAITVAMEELQMHNSNVNLSHYLFPAPVAQSEPYGFMTQKGSVYLKTTLSPENTVTKILIKEGTSVVYQKEVISKHSLIVESVLV